MVKAKTEYYVVDTDTVSLVELTRNPSMEEMVTKEE